MEAVQLGRIACELSWSEWKWNSEGESVMGFRYLRRAGSGGSVEGNGRLSSVKCGEMPNKDLAR